MQGLVLAGAVSMGMVLTHSEDVAAQEAPILVTAEWLADHMDEVLVINVHYRPGDYAEEHIPGAQFVGWGEFVSNDDPGAEMKALPEMIDVFKSAGVSNDQDVVFYAPHPIPAARGFLPGSPSPATASRHFSPNPGSTRSNGCGTSTTNSDPSTSPSGEAATTTLGILRSTAAPAAGPGS